MADQEHIEILKQGVEVWNKWRVEHPLTRPELNHALLSHSDLKYADLSGADLYKADLSYANLNGTIFSGANLIQANLRGANLSGAYLMKVDLSIANLIEANLSRTNLSGAYLCGTIFRGANFYQANLSDTNLRGADLRRAILVRTNLEHANLTSVSIHGISVWDVLLNNTIQSSLVITNRHQPTISVDSLKVAQFIYLILNNPEIREVIDTITSKVVLILGRFTPERKAVLDALRDELRHYNLLPVVFDFEPSAKRDLTETISTLAHMSRFIIADLTDAKSIPQELEAIVPHLPSVPIQPILHKGAKEYAMFEHFIRYPWVLPIYHYSDTSSFLASIKEHIIKPVEQKTGEREQIRELEQRIRELEEDNRRLKARE